MIRYPVSLALAATLGLSACSFDDGNAASGTSALKATTKAPAPAAAQLPNSGKVTQLQQAGMYTYAEVDIGGGRRVWIAGGHIDARVGQTVQWGSYAVMEKFHAKSLNRTFDQILFVSTWGPAGGKAAETAPHGTMPGGQPGMAGLPPMGAQPGMAGHPPMGGQPGMAGHPPMGAQPAAPAQPAAASANRGRVKSVATGGGYSYVEVQQGGASVWIAAPETQVKVGDTVSWQAGPVMQNFNAKSINRTFDRILFSGGVSVVR